MSYIYIGVVYPVCIRTYVRTYIGGTQKEELHKSCVVANAVNWFTCKTRSTVMNSMIIHQHFCAQHIELDPPYITYIQKQIRTVRQNIIYNIRIHHMPAIITFLCMYVPYL